MKIMLNRVPYMCPVLEDHTGSKGGQYIFTEKWVGEHIDLDLEKDDGVFWVGKIQTYYEGKPGGWLRLEIMKDCFDILET